ncbi:hypothetical protein CP10743SC13_0829B, partial [Chlamydia psittaci 10_743_SC13]
NDFDYFS